MQIFKSLTVAEWLIAAVGLLLFANVFHIQYTGDFTLWYGAKVLYVLGLLVLLFQHSHK